jgi:hypothetical protein
VYWLLLGALLVLHGARRAAAGRRRFDLLNGRVEDQAIDVLLPVKDRADHGTRTHSCVAR